MDFKTTSKGKRNPGNPETAVSIAKTRQKGLAKSVAAKQKFEPREYPYSEASLLLPFPPPR